MRLGVEAAIVDGTLVPGDGDLLVSCNRPDRSYRVSARLTLPDLGLRGLPLDYPERWAADAA
jgi:hypothetical protein